ncbi:MAG: substrate-binding domain-containing protein [Oscillospiraceae bacterium]
MRAGCPLTILDAIVCENDGMAVGAGNAAGANSGIVIAGVDGTPDGFEAIQDGRISGTVSQNGGAYGCKRHRGCC